MNNMQMQMDQFTHNAFWLDDRITVTFQLGPEATPIPPPGEIPSGHIVTNNEMTAREGSPPTFDKTSAINALNLRELNDFLDKSNYPILNTIDFTDTMRTPGAIPPANPEQIGKYLFTSIDDQGQYVPTVICFFKFDSMAMKSSPVGSPTANTSMSGNGQANDNHKNDGNDNGKSSSDPVVSLVNFINRQDTLEYLRNQLNVPIISASPTWLTGGSPYAPVGCPLSPPIPVPGDAHCSSSPGLWPIMLPELSTDLERMTGDGVHVIILDTLPRQEDMMRTLEGAEDHNLLLLDVVNNVVMHHNLLPVGIDEPNPKQPKTGKDIKGRNGGGFRMADHGLFIAGIVRDVAPYAHVECIRALNDFCAGESTAFVKALESVENRMLLVNPDDNNKQGDLYQKKVVINLSCVVPPDTYLQMLGIVHGDVRADLIKPIKALVDLGALFAASAGNEGDTRYQPANPTHIRPDALYPAQFAYKGVGTIKALGNSMIPVGAVDKHGNPTSYSCYPGELGIATYGGDVPKHFKQDESGCFTEAEDLDALIGIYTSLSYPALLLEDCRPTYPVPNSHAWAYWSGTSFATPIITGLVARILQYKLENPSALIPPDININQALTNMGVTTHQITWDRLDPGFHSETGQMILAMQKCESSDHDDHDDKRERVDVHVTINERD
ncbi:MAG TPA: S8/S53 family peptidase [Ktedonobacteraceae bacterium]